MDYLGPILDPPGPPPGTGPLGEVSCAPREATRGGRDNLWHFSAKHLYFGRLKLSKTCQKGLKMVILEGFGGVWEGSWRGPNFGPPQTVDLFAVDPQSPTPDFEGFVKFQTP